MENSNIKKIFYNSTSMLMANYLAYTISFVISVLLIRYLGAARFGQFSFIIAFVSFFGFLGDFGIGRLLIREVSKNKDKSASYLGNFLALQSLLSVFIFLSIVICINLLNYPQDIKNLVYIAGIGTSLYLISRAFETIITAHELIYFNAVISVSYKVIYSILIAVVIVLGRGLFELMIMFLATNILIIIISGSICAKNCCWPRWEIDFKEWKLYLKNGFEFGLINLFAVTTANIGIIILSKIKGDTQVGLFSSAYKIPLSIILIANSLDVMLYPLFSRQYSMNKDKAVIYFRKAARYLSFLGFPIAVFFCFFSRQVIVTFFGKGYWEAIPAMQILVWVVPFSFLSVVCNTLLMSINKVRPVTIMVGLNCSLYLVLNIIFQQTYGYLALCWLTLLVPLFSVGVLYYFIHKQVLKAGVFISEILPPIIISGILAVISSQIRIPSLWLIILLYCSIYIMLLAFFILIDSYDRGLLKALISNLRVKRHKVI